MGHDLALLGAAVMLGVAGMPHCLAMCTLACSAACGNRNLPVDGWTLGAWQGARLLSYAAGGALAASGLALLGQWASVSAMLRPWWTLAHVAALMLGLWLLWRGQWPQGLSWRHARLEHAVVTMPQPTRAAARRWRAGALGLAWVALPCGLLQTALLMASLANSAQGGALVMAGFALVTGGAMSGLAPWLQRSRADAGSALRRNLLRLAGALVAGASAWSLLQVARQNGYCQF
jgi:uncharacterized protein